MQALATAVVDQGSRVRVVTTLRADFYDRPLLHPEFGELLATRTHAVWPMRGEELERAIVGPAESAGARFEPGLVGAIVSDVTDQPGSLPHLQHALTELFDARTESTLTLDSYRQVGRISGALSGRAESVYRGLNEATRAAARQIFLRLIKLGEDGSGDSRQRVKLSELVTLGVEQPAIERVIDAFGSHRFLTFDRDALTRGPTVEVAHEALLDSWRRLRTWIDSSREDLRTQRRLALTAGEWDAAGREPSFLLRGSRLEQFASWAAGTDVKLSALEREYLDASVSARDAGRAVERARQQREVSLQRRSVNRLRALVAALTIGVLAAGTLALVAQERGTRAEREARIATARELTFAAMHNLNVNTEQSLLLALRAVETTRRVDGTVLPEAEEALHAALQAHRLVLTVPGYRARFTTEGSQLLIVGSGPGQADVRDVRTGSLILTRSVRGRDQAHFISTELVFSPDGRRFATTTDDYHVAVYDTASGQELWHWGGCCGKSAITPDSRFLVTADDVATYLFDLDTGKQVNSFPPTGGTWSFAPDGQRAMVTDGGWNSDLETYITAYIGELHKPGGGARILRLTGQGDVNGAAWSPDGSSAATSSPNNLVIWDTRTGRPRFTLSPPEARFTTLAFGTDAALLATGMSDGAAIIWKVGENGAVPALRLAGHDAETMSVAFSPDGTRLVTGSSDRRIKVWDITAQGGGESLTVAGFGGLDISSDGQLIAAGGDAGHARVFDTVTGEQMVDLAAHTTRVDVVAFGPGGSTLLTSGSDGTVMSEVSGRVVWRLPPSQDGPNVVAMSQDGAIAAILVSDGTVNIVDGKTGATLTALRHPDNEQTPELVGRSIAFTADGRLIAVAGGYPYVHIWSIDGHLRVQLKHPFVTALAFSPDGRRLITVGMTEGIGAVRVYDTDLGRMLGSLKARSEITGVAFSPDGSRIATTSTDGTLRLWEATSLEQLMVLATDATGNFAFSPDGTRLAYGAKGDVVRVLALGIDDLIQLANDRLARSQAQR
jgi:WD40 repeat protein